MEGSVYLARNGAIREVLLIEPERNQVLLMEHYRAGKPSRDNTVPRLGVQVQREKLMSVKGWQAWCRESEVLTEWNGVAVEHPKTFQLRQEAIQQAQYQKEQQALAAIRAQAYWKEQQELEKALLVEWEKKECLWIDVKAGLRHGVFGMEPKNTWKQKRWIAKVKWDVNAYRGISRQFLPFGQIQWHYQTEQLQAGQWIEVAADDASYWRRAFYYVWKKEGTWFKMVRFEQEWMERVKEEEVIAVWEQYVSRYGEPVMCW
jgi:hypothetical protein